MAIELNEQAYQHAMRLIEERRAILDIRDEWSEHRPSKEEEDRYIREHGIDEYGKWYLGIETNEVVSPKARYSFPLGDFEKIHRCAVLAAEIWAGRIGPREVAIAAARLHAQLGEVE